MLPFLKKDKVAGMIIHRRKPDQKPEQEPEDTHQEAVKAAAQDLLDAIHSDDVMGVAAALENAFEILDSMPHEEGEHIDESEIE